MELNMSKTLPRHYLLLFTFLCIPSVLWSLDWLSNSRVSWHIPGRLPTVIMDQYQMRFLCVLCTRCHYMGIAIRYHALSSQKSWNHWFAYFVSIHAVYTHCNHISRSVITCSNFLGVYKAQSHLWQ